MKTSHFLLAMLVVISLTGCPSPKSGVFEACQEYKRLLECEARLRARSPTSINCTSLSKKFDTTCSQSDIAYAAKIFTSDANRLCALQTQDDVKAFKSAFDARKISPACYQAAEPCGLNCMQFDINEVP